MLTGNMTIIHGDFYNALYENGKLKIQAKPDYLHAETLSNIFPDAEFYGVPYELYDELVGDKDGYPDDLIDFPLYVCDRYR